MLTNAPEGYRKIEILIKGSNTRAVVLLVCLKCGVLVNDHDIHTKWHKGETRKIVVNEEEIEISVEVYERLKQKEISSVNYWPVYLKEVNDADK